MSQVRRMTTNATAAAAVEPDRALWSFISGHKLPSGQHDKQYTHVSLLNPYSGKFRIAGSVSDELLELYCQRLAELGPANFVFGLAEKPHAMLNEEDTTINPVLCDVDIKLDFSPDIAVDRHFYTTEHVNKVVEIYQDVLQEVCDGIDSKNLLCFVLEKSGPYITEDGLHIKNGFHLHFPFCYMYGSNLDAQVYPMVKKRISDERVFATLPHFEGDSGSLMDTDLNKKNWLMYGSRKSLNSEGYLLTRILNFRRQTITLSDALRNNPILNTRDEPIVTERTPNPEYYLPYILSLSHYNRPLLRSKSNNCELARPRIRQAVNTNNYRDIASLPEVIAEARQLVGMLKDSRTDTHNEWYKVGMILYDVTHGCIEGCDLWYEFSRRSTLRRHVDEARCITNWQYMAASREGSYSIGSLKALAKEDNPTLYNDYFTKKNKTRISTTLKFLPGNTSDLAKMLHERFSSEIVCADLDRNIWYYYDETLNRWQLTSKGNALWVQIDKYLVPIYMEAKRANNAVVEEDGGGSGGANDDRSRQDSLSKIISKLKSASFKEQLMKECARMFNENNQDFIEKLDSDNYLFGCTNGVIDLRQMRFRRGEPSDYISRSCGFAWEDYTNREDDPNIIEIINFFNKIMPDKDNREFLYDYLGQIIRGGNLDQKFAILTGRGANGKSSFQQLLIETLGGESNISYAGKFSPTLLTGKEADSNSAQPEMLAAKGKRAMFISEPNQQAKLNINIIKYLTGNESISCRGLYSNPITFTPAFKFMFICNKVPRIDYDPDDDGIWRRILRINFPSKFPEKDHLVPESFNEQFKKRIFLRDPHFNEKIKKLRPALLYMMFKCYKRSLKRKIPVPLDVERTIDVYREENDVVLQFLRERLFFQAGESLTVADCYLSFVDWYTATFGPASRNKVMSRLEMSKQLSQKPGLTEPHNGRWNNVRFRSLDDDVEEGTAVRYEHTAAAEDQPAA